VEWKKSCYPPAANQCATKVLLAHREVTLTNHPSFSATNTPGPFGQPVRRIEDPALLKGQGRFADDTHLPGMLEASFVRSAFARAKIRSIDTAAAKAMEGVAGIFVLKDLRPQLSTDQLSVGMPSDAYKQVRDRPILANTEVCHVGEPIAVVIAKNRYIAEDAAMTVTVSSAQRSDLTVLCRSEMWIRAV